MMVKLLIAMAIPFVAVAYAAPLDDALKALVGKTRLEDAEYGDVKALRDQLKSAFPNTDQALVGESVFAWYLTGESKPRKIGEIRASFQSLQPKGESKWYVVYARLALAAAYDREEMHAEAKAIAREAIAEINPEDLKQSFLALQVVLNAAFGEEQFTGGTSNMDNWMDAFQALATD